MSSIKHRHPIFSLIAPSTAATPPALRHQGWATDNGDDDDAIPLVRVRSASASSTTDVPSATTTTVATPQKQPPKKRRAGTWRNVSHGIGGAGNFHLPAALRLLVQPLLQPKVTMSVGCELWPGASIASVYQGRAAGAVEPASASSNGATTPLISHMRSASSSHRYQTIANRRNGNSRQRESERALSRPHVLPTAPGAAFLSRFRAIALARSLVAPSMMSRNPDAGWRGWDAWDWGRTPGSWFVGIMCVRTNEQHVIVSYAKRRAARLLSSHPQQQHESRTSRVDAGNYSTE
ncbi:hypothetical protein IWZ01DRAFT_484669 [Phyllosticta capitalensis]